MGQSQLYLEANSRCIILETWEIKYASSWLILTNALQGCTFVLDVNIRQCWQFCSTSICTFSIAFLQWSFLRHYCN